MKATFYFYSKGMDLSKGILSRISRIFEGQQQRISLHYRSSVHVWQMIGEIFDPMHLQSAVLKESTCMNGYQKGCGQISVKPIITIKDTTVRIACSVKLDDNYIMLDLVY